ncbi:MAG: hypothetical protein ABIJ58_01620 [Nanoarchaeota archaeon]
MKSSQWFVLAGIFLVGVIMFSIMANTAMKGELMITKTQIDIWDKTGEFPEMGIGDIIFPLRHSIYTSFHFLCWLGLMGCLICGWIESHSKKRKKNEEIAKLIQKSLDMSDESFVRKIARKYDLKEIPKDTEELEEISKKYGKKEKEIKKEIDDYLKNTEERRETWLNYLKKGS